MTEWSTHAVYNNSTMIQLFCHYRFIAGQSSSDRSWDEHKSWATYTTHTSTGALSQPILISSCRFGPPLQLSQSSERLSARFWRGSFVITDIDVGGEGLVPPKGFRSELCHAQSWWDSKGPPPKLFPENWKLRLVASILVIWSIKIYLKWNLRAETPKNKHTATSLLHQTSVRLGMFSWRPPNTGSPCLSGCQIQKCGASLHTTCFTAAESTGGVFYTTSCDAWWC